jgi:hypothetical protein
MLVAGMPLPGWEILMPMESCLAPTVVLGDENLGQALPSSAGLGGAFNVFLVNHSAHCFDFLQEYQKLSLPKVPVGYAMNLQSGNYSPIQSNFTKYVSKCLHASPTLFIESYDRIHLLERLMSPMRAVYRNGR